MSVVTGVKRRREFSRRRDIFVAVQNMTDLVRILLLHARQRELRKSFRCFFIKSGCSIFLFRRSAY